MPSYHLLYNLASENPRTATFKTTDTLSKTGETATLTLPDGRSYPLDLMRPTHGDEILVDIRSLHLHSGNRLLMYDPGLHSVATCSSAVSYLNGDTGDCLYRGYHIGDLVEHADFVTVAYLLLYGDLPTDLERKTFEEELIDNSLIHQKLISITHEFSQDTHPMSIVAALFSVMASFYRDSMNLSHMTDNETRDLDCLRILAQMPSIVAMAYKHIKGEPIVHPRADQGYVANFLYMMFATPLRPYVVDPFHTHVMDVFLSVHAEHEQNASTNIVRTTGSCLANPFACISTGATSLWGRAHGGASESVIDMLEEIGSPVKVRNFLETSKLSEVPIPGFSHRVYRAYDSRAKVLRRLCWEMTVRKDKPDPLYLVAVELEREALADAYYQHRRWFPNVDFYSGLVLRGLGIPKQLFSVLFAMGRTVGWLAHYREISEEMQLSICRPRQLYVGVAPRTLIPTIVPPSPTRVSNDNKPEPETEEESH